MWTVAALFQHVCSLHLVIGREIFSISMDNSHSSSVDGSSLISDGHGLIWSVLSSAFRKTPALINEEPPRPMIPSQKKKLLDFVFHESWGHEFHLPWAAKECCPSPKNTWKSRVGSPDDSHFEMKELFVVLPEMLISFRHWENVSGNEPAMGMLVMVFWLKPLDPYIFFPSQVLALRRSSLLEPFDLPLLQRHSQIL